MKNKIKEMKGFTLVELLIVIALIAILSVAVLATINPIEQSNKARDAKFRNDTAEVLSAYERYYASQNKYPWSYPSLAHPTEVVLDGTSGISFLATDWRFGVIDAADTNGGQLITTSELKSAFTGKDFFKDIAAAELNGVDAVYAFHSGDNNYVCYCPKANANRTGTVGTTLKCLNAVTDDGSAVLSDIGTGTCAVPADPKATDYCTIGASAANLMCVPEGNVAL
ncbi:MAG: type II secretion system protein [Candidatus Shapirobacteria bacterium]|nr:type II secretion system protein [Candidatus Shapirobacteria bacterium]MDD4410379.1 type II secretion system protein [Candidatus Shapirobacteria bacterium]